MVAEAVEVELERLGLDQITCGQIIDHQMRKIRLTGNRAEGRKLRRSETRNIIRADVGVRHTVEYGRSGELGIGLGRPNCNCFLAISVYRTVYASWMPVSRRGMTRGLSIL